MENFILGFLSIRPMGGYELRSIMNQSIAMFMEISFGTLFPALKRLEKRKLISSSRCEQKSNKIVYQITSAGRQALTEWLDLSESRFKLNYEFLAKLFFSGNRPSKDVIAQVHHHIQEIEMEIDKTKLIKNSASDKADFHQMLTIQFALDFLMFLRNWHEQLSHKLAINK